MNEFIKTIESIGFKKWIHVKNRTNHRYEYKNWFIDIESNSHVKGTIFWNMHPHELGYRRGQPIQHKDGYTLHYPENRTQLLIISNHFRRMRGLPEVTEL